MQCGISCISMICRYYGKKIPVKVLEKHCTPSKYGVTFSESITRNIAVEDRDIAKITLSYTTYD